MIAGKNSEMKNYSSNLNDPLSGTDMESQDNTLMNLFQQDSASSKPGVVVGANHT